MHGAGAGGTDRHGADRRAGAGARRRAPRALRPRGADHRGRGAQGQLPVHGRSGPRDRGARGLRVPRGVELRGDQVVGRRPDHAGSAHRHLRPPRAAGRGHRQHGSDPRLPPPDPRGPQPGEHARGGPPRQAQPPHRGGPRGSRRVRDPRSVRRRLRARSRPAAPEPAVHRRVPVA